MKRLLVLLGLIGMLALTFGGCGLEEGGLSPGDAGLGGAGTGGTGVAGGTCFPGSKVCTDSTGSAVCNPADVPEFGCSQTTQCDACAIQNGTAKCDAGKCAVASCNEPWQDCDGDPANGCESNKLVDYGNCGTCGVDCTAPPNNLGWICVAGICEVNECCPTGDPACLTKRDCNGNKQDGCEVDVAGDPLNCGFCGVACSLPHAQSACSQSVCVVTQCDTGYANCDGNDANGCETNIANDVGNCGACSNKCNTTNGGAQCVGGNCTIQCSPGWGNCNGTTNDGCETNTNTDPLHCGSCPKKCNSTNGTATCAGGNCGINCNSGFGNCDNNVGNGCETNTNTSTNHCSTCGNKCPAPTSGTAFCANGVCGDNCGSLVVCTGSPSYCANTTNDVNNCGQCGKVCPNNVANSTPVCSNGNCGFTCNNGYAKCGSTNTCYDIGSDPTHCGSACTNCAGAPVGSSDPTCSNGTCGFNCKNPTPNKCGSNCVNLQNDKNNCKVCGSKCTDPANGTNNCVAGNCTISCNSGLTNCGGQCVNITNDMKNCGGCGTTCTAGDQLCCGGQCKDIKTDDAFCGSCTNACNTSTEDCCNGTCLNVQSDPAHCGNCTTTCSGGKTCTGGSCSCPPATPDTCGTACVNKQTDSNHCGNCDNKCGPGSSCSSGTCTCTTVGQTYCDNTVGCKECCGPNDTQAECSGGNKCCNGVCKPAAGFTCP